MHKIRIFARIENGAIAEIVPPLPMDNGWLQVMPDDGDVRALYAFPYESWVELTDMDPMPKENWTYTGGLFAEPAPVEPIP